MTSEKRYLNTTAMVMCGLFAGLTAICSFITIPLGFTPVPVNLATLAVFLAGGILGKKYGTISILVYILIGTAGLPVFAGFRGGPGVLAGPTGGYILGYAAAAFVTGLIIEKFSDKCQLSRANSGKVTAKFTIFTLSMTAGLALCYFLGTVFFMLSTGSGLVPALVSCVIPFLPGDAVKIAAAVILTERLRPFMSRLLLR